MQTHSKWMKNDKTELCYYKPALASLATELVLLSLMDSNIVQLKITKVPHIVVPKGFILGLFPVRGGALPTGVMDFRLASQRILP